MWAVKQQKLHQNVKRGIFDHARDFESRSLGPTLLLGSWGVINFFTLKSGTCLSTAFK